MYKKIIRLCAVISLLLITSSIYAQTDRDIAIYANATVYENPQYDSVAVIDFPFTLNRSDFKFYKPDSTATRYYARVFVQVDLYGINGTVVDSTNTYFSLAVDNLQQARTEDYRIFNKLSLIAKPGIYSARLTVIDVVNKNEGMFYIENLQVHPPVHDHIKICGLNTAYDIKFNKETAEKPNTFLNKNGYTLYINPVSVFSNTDTVLYLYGEIYNLAYDPANPTKYQLIVNLLDNFGNLSRMYGARLITKPGTSSVIAQSVDIRDLGIGHFKFQVIAQDMETNTADTAVIPVHIVSPQEVLAAAESGNPDKPFIDPYDTMSLKDKVQMMTYILNAEQKKTLNGLSDVGKENFLDVYWREKDETPETPINEYRYEMIRRYNFANANFSTNDLKTNGYLSDRARIYMKYGHWEERDDREAPIGGNPFVIWYYHSIEGGLIFVFEDYMGDDEYHLVHSNAHGEVYSNDWAEALKTGFFDVIQR